MASGASSGGVLGSRNRGSPFDCRNHTTGAGTWMAPQPNSTAVSHTTSSDHGMAFPTSHLSIDTIQLNLRPLQKATIRVVALSPPFLLLLHPHIQNNCRQMPSWVFLGRSKASTARGRAPQTSAGAAVQAGGDTRKRATCHEREYYPHTRRTGKAHRINPCGGCWIRYVEAEEPARSRTTLD